MSGREAWRDGAAETLRAVGEMCVSMAEALEKDDGILGAIAGMGLADNLPELPAHIRAAFIKYLSDEAAAGARSDRLYWEANA